MNLSSTHTITALVGDAQPYLVGAASTLTVLLIAMAIFRTVRPRNSVADPVGDATSTDRSRKIANRLTFLVAVVIGGLSARGMGHFFYAKLGFPLELVVVAAGIFEVAYFTCALRARLNIQDPDVGRAGADGVAVWVIAGLSGFFSAMDAGLNEVGLFQLVLPFLAAWLWHRGMAIEIRRLHGTGEIHLRVTLERILVWLRVAEPSGRSASEVDAHRRLTKVATAAVRVRSLRDGNGRRQQWRLGRAKARLERAMRSAVTHAGLAQDPARQEALLAQIGSLYNASRLADLTPRAPWQDHAAATHATLFEAMGVPFTPARLEITRQALPQGSDPDPVQVTHPAVTQDAEQVRAQVTHQVTSDSDSHVTPERQNQTTVTAVAHPARKTASKSRASGHSKPRRSDEDLKAEIQLIVAEHYRTNPGVEIEVKPLAKRLRIGRDRARKLLAEMNVRPIRKASNQ